jgi:hypothetical protein
LFEPQTFLLKPYQLPFYLLPQFQTWTVVLNNDEDDHDLDTGMPDDDDQYLNNNSNNNYDDDNNNNDHDDDIHNNHDNNNQHQHHRRPILQSQHHCKNRKCKSINANARIIDASIVHPIKSLLSFLDMSASTGNSQSKYLERVRLKYDKISLNLNDDLDIFDAKSFNASTLNTNLKYPAKDGVYGENVNVDVHSSPNANSIADVDVNVESNVHFKNPFSDNDHDVFTDADADADADASGAIDDEMDGNVGQFRDKYNNKNNINDKDNDMDLISKVNNDIKERMESKDDQHIGIDMGRDDTSKNQVGISIPVVLQTDYFSHKK